MIRRLLVANRGEIARRIFATCRVVGIETVAVYSDADAGAPFVAEADYAVHLPGNSPTATYLRGDRLVTAALEAGADAIHPGYGFLSEQAEFASAVIDAGLTWIGPPPKAIALMGSKVEAKALLADAGVPMLPSWSEPAQVTDFPVLVKASAGGGGRGMRVVREAESLAEAIASARREAAAAFGDGTVFCERYVERARHIEVQILADAHGGIVTFGERECSIQRRHQKIIEETPSPVVTPELRQHLCASAVAAAQAVGYVGVGTVEFLLAPTSEFYFLEMNTRLQVEHPVTEEVTRLDLVATQLRVAAGEPLPFAQDKVEQRGAAIEVRIYAEDPARNFLPSPGTITRLSLPYGEGIRLESGVVEGSAVSVHYDPLLFKLIARGTDRAQAIERLAQALDACVVEGVKTTLPLLRTVVAHADFRRGQVHTQMLEQGAFHG